MSSGPCADQQTLSVLLSVDIRIARLRRESDLLLLMGSSESNSDKRGLLIMFL